jgi:cytoskeleton protein RodZ
MNIETESNQQPSIGQMLNQAREARGLTLQQVASQLNLAVALIEKLEQDQFNGDMQETYVRGYIRAYAKLLKIPEKQLVTAFSLETGRQRFVAKPMQTFSNRTKLQTTDKRFLWLTYGIIALFIVLLFVWWWQTEAESEQSTQKQATNNNTTEQMTPSPLNLNDTVSAAEPAKPQSAVMLVESIAVDTQAAAKLQQMLVSIQAEIGANTEDSAETLIGQDSLTMQFYDACWVNVIDAEGERIAFGTKEKGYVMELKGKAPFVVTLGNPAVVTIRLNQQPYDISTLPIGRVAKFTIPGSE